MWLIEAYRTSHGPSFWREVLTVAAGNYPDADDIEVFVSFYDIGMERVRWRNTETGGVVWDEGLDNWLGAYSYEKLGDGDTKLGPKYWRLVEAGD